MTCRGFLDEIDIREAALLDVRSSSTSTEMTKSLTYLAEQPQDFEAS